MTKHIFILLLMIVCKFNLAFARAHENNLYSREIKLITLNIWGGSVYEPLKKFIKAHQDVDIFVLQEAYKEAPSRVSSDDAPVNLNIFSELHALLPNHHAYFRPVVKGVYGIGIIIKKDLEVLSEGEHNIHDNPNYVGLGPTHSRILQWITCRLKNSQPFTVINVHGLWNGKGKSDSPERLLQSERIKGFLNTLDTPKVLCGDFNLRPDTESIKIIETGMINLISKYEITSTRTSLYPKEEKFADYIFTSDKVRVNNFRAMEDVVSDHVPLLLEFAVPQKRQD